MFKSALTGLVLSTALTSAAFASSALHELSPDQISADVERRVNPETQRIEYVARDFDPFEGEGSLAGSAALRSAHDGITISGKPIHGGAYLDVSVIYTTQTADYYDKRGLDYAVYVSGEPVEYQRYDTQVLECSSSPYDFRYDDGYYTGARYGFLAGIYRLYPRYRGHSHYRYNNYGYWGHNPYDYGSYSYYRHRDRHLYNRDGSRRYSDRHRDRDRYRDRRDDGQDGHLTNNTTTTTAVPRVNGRPQTGQALADRGRNPAEFRANPFERRLTNGDRRRSRDRQSDTRVNEQQDIRVTPTTRPRSERAFQRRVEPVKRYERREPVRTTTRQSQPPKQMTRRAEPPKQIQRSSQPPKQAFQRPAQPPKNVSPPKRRSQPVKRSETRKNTRSESRSRSNNRSRSVDKTFRSSQRSMDRRAKNFYPVTSNYSYASSGSRNCVKEEVMSLHIPQERLMAARYDGLSVILLDRQGGDVPVYLPPNYINGFLQAQGYHTDPRFQSEPYGGQNPSGYR